MFSRKNQIGGVRGGFQVFRELVYYRSDDKLIEYALGSAEIKREKGLDGFDLETIQILDDGSLVGLSEEEIIFYDANLSPARIIKVESAADPILENEYVISDLDYDGKSRKSKYGLFNIKKEINEWTTDWAGMVIASNLNALFTVDPATIEKRGRLSGEIEWAFCFERDPKGYYPQLIGLVKTIAFFGLEGLDKLIALNIATGELVWEIETFAKGIVLDPDKKLLHQVMVNYGAFDVYTGELKVNYNNSEYFESVGIESQRSNFVVVGDHIITTDMDKGVAGAFNTVTHRFDWVHREPDVFFPAPKPIRYEAPYLFLHDSDNTLHVFERE